MVQYEIYPTEPERQLTVDEEKIFQDGMNINPKTIETGITTNVGITFTQAEHVLARWHDDIEQAVSEGKQYENYADVYIPKAKTEAEKIALTLIHLKRVEYDCLPKNSIKKKVNKGEEITRTIVTSTQITEPIKVVAYLANNSEDSDNNNEDMTSLESVSGTAVKNGATTWTVFSNKQQLSVTNNNLMDPSQFFVKCKWLSDKVNSFEKKKESATKKEHVCLKSIKKSKKSVRRKWRSCKNKNLKM